MCDAGINHFVEVSPGRSLWGLLGQLPPPHSFTRRYVECVRGLNTRRAKNQISKGGVWGRRTRPPGLTSEEQESA
jgi:hypothetical protein